MSHKTRVLTLLPILAIVLTACTHQDLPLIGKYFGGNGNGNGGDIGDASLNVWGLWEGVDVLDPVLQSFQVANPTITVNYEDRSVLELNDYKERAFSRAKDPSGPDVMLVHNSWVPSLIASGSLVPAPSSIMSTEQYFQSFYPVASSAAVLNEEVYGIPISYDGLVLVYNTQHFAEIGQTSPPTAWEEFRRLALQLTVYGEDEVIIRSGAAMGSATNIDHFSDILGLMWAQAGVEIPGNIDSKAAQDALDFYANFLREDKVWNPNKFEAVRAFADGDVSMIIVPSWRIMELLGSVGDSSIIGVAPIPQAVPSNPASWASFWVYVVPQSSKNPKASWIFVDYMTQPKQQLALFSEASKYRVFGMPYSHVELAAELSSSPYLRPALSTASFATGGEVAARSGNRRQVSALRDAVNAVLSGASSSEALTTAKSEMIQ